VTAGHAGFDSILSSIPIYVGKYLAIDFGFHEEHVALQVRDRRVALDDVGQRCVFQIGERASGELALIPESVAVRGAAGTDRR